MTLTIRTLFAGIGGDAEGAASVEGVKVVHAMNHWPRAIEVHAANHPYADHTCEDISLVNPRRFAPTDLLWGSPECTWHSKARGKRSQETESLFEGDGRSPEREVAERSRALMWDMVTWAEAHRYKAILVENVPEITDWPPFRAWLLAFESLGYRWQVLSINSMHAQAHGLPAPQSRDRIYVALWRKKLPAPDFERIQRPRAYCPGCDQTVESRKSWRPGREWGAYRRDYMFICPGCRGVVEPAWLPALTALDLTDLGTRIGDRKKRLVPNTRRRAAAGIARHWLTGAQPLHVSLMGTSPRQLDTSARPVERELRTITASGNNDYLLSPPLMVPYYGSSTSSSPVTRPVGTLTTRDRYALVMRNNGTKGNLAWATTPADEVLRTLTTKGHQSVINPPRGEITVQTLADAEAILDDCYYRMFKPLEVAGGMAFRPTYKFGDMTGTEIVKGSGNAVTPPSARDLIACAIEPLIA